MGMALTTQTSSGGQTADFQPVTSNPQSNVGGGLQPNNANLQPTTAANNTNAFNQPGINPQAFPQTNSLQVLGTHTGTLTPAVTQNAPPPPGPHVLAWFLIVALAAIAGLLLLAKTAKPAKGQQVESKDPPKDIAAALQPKPKKKKARRKKKASLKRK
jgi:hypothetical protein